MPHLGHGLNGRQTHLGVGVFNGRSQIRIQGKRARHQPAERREGPGLHGDIRVDQPVAERKNHRRKHDGLAGREDFECFHRVKPDSGIGILEDGHKIGYGGRRDGTQDVERARGLLTDTGRRILQRPAQGQHDRALGQGKLGQGTGGLGTHVRLGIFQSFQETPGEAGVAALQCARSRSGPHACARLLRTQRGAHGVADGFRKGRRAAQEANHRVADGQVVAQQFHAGQKHGLAIAGNPPQCAHHRLPHSGIGVA